MSTFQMRYPGGLAKAVTFSYDDGVAQDIRLVEIFNRYGLKATFNINTSRLRPGVVAEGKGAMGLEQARDLYRNSPHEVAVHTLTHPRLEPLAPELVTYEVLEDRTNVEDIFGTVCRGMAYPFGFSFDRDSDTTVDILKACGILYARTTTPSFSLKFPTDWLRLKPTCHHDSDRLAELSDKFLNEPCTDAPWLLYVWGHSFEFDTKGNWDKFRGFAEKISGKSDVWYATNIEIFDYADAYRRLRFSIAFDRVCNPTAHELFFYCRATNKSYSVAPGQTLTID